MAVVVAVPLNAVFLLGTWHYSYLRLGTGSEAATAASFDAFFEKQANEWKISAEDAMRVRSGRWGSEIDQSHRARRGRTHMRNG